VGRHRHTSGELRPVDHVRPPRADRRLHPPGGVGRGHL